MARRLRSLQRVDVTLPTSYEPCECIHPTPARKVRGTRLWVPREPPGGKASSGLRFPTPLWNSGQLIWRKKFRKLGDIWFAMTHPINTTGGAHNEHISN